MWGLRRGWGGRQSAVGRCKMRDSDRQLGGQTGMAGASDGAWAHVEYALPGRQRRSASEFGPGEIMSCPGGAELGHDRAGRIAVG